MNIKKKITISAIGDISFTGNIDKKPSAKIFKKISDTWADSDLVVGNLEGPLLDNGRSIPGKCVLKADPGWADILSESGINLVSLANNHMMDFGAKGLFNTINILKNTGIHFLGAGENLKKACSPLILELNNVRIGFLARSSVLISSSSYYATQNKPGIAFFNYEETIRQVQKLKLKVDIIILLIHWGIENYQFPSPSQRTLAKQLLENGVNIIMGHHPHVLQGIEYIEKGIVAYSLGNFLFDDFDWSFCDSNGNIIPQKYILSPGNRRGMILKLKLNENKPVSHKVILTQINNDGTIIKVDNEKAYKINRFLSKKFESSRYKPWWRFYALRQEWHLRLKNQFSFWKIIRKIYKIRPSHIKHLLSLLKKSSQIASEKTTNPYD